MNAIKGKEHYIYVAEATYLCYLAHRQVPIYSPAMDDFWKQEEQQGESWYLDSRGRGHLSSEVRAGGAKRAKKKGELNEAPVAPCAVYAYRYLL